jgi:hypothetical protein
MRTSSARQQLDFPGLNTTDALSGAGRLPEFVGDGEPSMEASVGTFSPLSAPSAGVYGAAYAVTSRLLGRLNTTMVKPEEFESLLRERQNLLDKKFDGTMTRQDENRLEYVRWSLDRIQDAKSGPALDALEHVVGVYERFLSDMDNFANQLNEAATRGNKGPRR